MVSDWVSVGHILRSSHRATCVNPTFSTSSSHCTTDRDSRSRLNARPSSDSSRKTRFVQRSRTLLIDRKSRPLLVYGECVENDMKRQLVKHPVLLRHIHGFLSRRSPTARRRTTGSIIDCSFSTPAVRNRITIHLVKP